MTKVLKQRKIPQRKCVACGERGDKKSLMRIVKNKEGEVFLDPTGKANGRGTYLHLTEECVEKSIKTRAIQRSFQSEVPDKIFEELKEEVKNIEK